MRIGLISGEYPPDRGGVGDFTHRLAHALGEHGHCVHVITSAHPSQPSEPKHMGDVTGSNPATIHRVADRWGIGCWRTISRLACELSLDVLDVQYQAAAYNLRPAINFVPARRPAPVAVTFHDLKVPYLFPKAGPLRGWIVHTLARRADGVIVTNREDELALREAGLGPSTVVRIPIGSNISTSLPDDYDRDAERSRFGIRPADLLLGYFGFLNESKGGEALIETLAHLVEAGLPAHLLKIGGRVGSSDPTNRAYANRVEQLIVELNLEKRVHWTGYLDSEQVSASLRAVDVCVLPYRDGVSFRRGSLLACLAHGRAIVTTQPAVRLPEVRDGENMVLTFPDSPLQLAQSVERIAADAALRARLETGALSLARNFEWDQIAKRTVRFFAGLMGGCA